MSLLHFAKVFQAIFLFVREMWLRDRTFRQYVRENLSFILVSVGFAVMTIMFVNLYIIVKDQESQVKIYEQRINLMTTNELKSAEDYREKIAWWKARYGELKETPTVKKEPTESKKDTTSPDNRNHSSTIKNKEIINRWNKLN